MERISVGAHNLVQTTDWKTFGIKRLNLGKLKVNKPENQLGDDGLEIGDDG